MTDERAKAHRTPFSTIHTSLALKVLAPVMLVFIATSVALFLFYTDRIRQQGLENLRIELESFASSKAAELSEPLWSFQDDLLARLMRSYRDNKNLHSIRLYEPGGKLLLEQASSNPGMHGTILATERSITRELNGETMELGRLVVEYHDNHLHSSMAARKQSDTMFIVVLVLVLATSSWLFIHYMIGRPLDRLKLSLRQNISREKREPLVWNSRDELGEVVDEYNSLLHEVEQQTNKLVKANRLMQAEIAQRIIAEEELARIHRTLENEVTVRTMELEQANTELRELDLQRTAFLSSASHELRTPLAAILGFSKLIKKSFVRRFVPLAAQTGMEDKSAQMVSNMEIIETEGDRLTRLIDDLLDLNRIEAGHMEWRDEELDLNEEVDRAVKTMSTTLGDKPEVTLGVSLEKDLPAVTMDPDRLQQVLINLLSNAVKHTDTGSIGVQTEAENGYVCFSVTDTGEGIPEADHESVFHKFYQSGSHDTVMHNGTGLGLPICKNIVEHYGGTIALHSEVGKGSRFTVALPAG